jgi:hypothetical protein
MHWAGLEYWAFAPVQFASMFVQYDAQSSVAWTAASAVVLSSLPQAAKVSESKRSRWVRMGGILEEDAEVRN